LGRLCSSSIGYPRGTMNDLTTQLLKLVLTDKEAWDKKKDAPDLPWINQQIQYGREILFYDKYYFPRMVKLSARLKEKNYWKLTEWFEKIMGYEKEFTCWVPVEQDYQILIADHLQKATEWIWDTEYEYEEVIEEDVRSTNTIAPWQQQLTLF